MRSHTPLGPLARSPGTRRPRGAPPLRRQRGRCRDGERPELLLALDGSNERSEQFLDLFMGRHSLNPPSHDIREGGAHALQAHSIRLLIVPRRPRAAATSDTFCTEIRQFDSPALLVGSVPRASRTVSATARSTPRAPSRTRSAATRASRPPVLRAVSARRRSTTGHASEQKERSQRTAAGSNRSARAQPEKISCTISSAKATSRGLDG